MTEKTFSIHEASRLLNVSEMYIRKCILENKIKTQQVYISDHVWRHEISESEIQKFKSRTSNRSSRKDNRNKFTVYLSKSEEQKIRKVLTENTELSKLNELLNRTNNSKK